MKSYPRTKRVNALLQQFLAEQMREHHFDGLGEYLTITRIDVKRDLAVADVLFLTHGNCEREAIQEQLEAIEGKLRGAAGRALRLRRIPELRFAYDFALDSGAELAMRLGEHADD